MPCWLLIGRIASERPICDLRHPDASGTGFFEFTSGNHLRPDILLVSGRPAALLFVISDPGSYFSSAHATGELWPQIHQDRRRFRKNTFATSAAHPRLAHEFRYRCSRSHNITLK
jgi:hypothetical protein